MLLGGSQTFSYSSYEHKPQYFFSALPSRLNLSQRCLFTENKQNTFDSFAMGAKPLKKRLFFHKAIDEPDAFQLFSVWQNLRPENGEAFTHTLMAYKPTPEPTVLLRFTQNSPTAQTGRTTWFFNSPQLEKPIGLVDVLNPQTYAQQQWQETRSQGDLERLLGWVSDWQSRTHSDRLSEGLCFLQERPLHFTLC